MFKLLQTFVAVYETRSFSKAAEQLFISQPTVSVHIKQLEKELNVQLFDRNGRTEFKPTHNARLLYQKALNLLNEWQTITDDFAYDQRIKIVIGASQTSATVLLPKILESIGLEKLCMVDFKIEMHNSEDILAGVLNHQFDFGMIEKPITHDYVVRDEIGHDQLVLAGDLKSDHWLVREKGSGVYHYTQQYFKQNNIIPKNAMTISNNDIITKLLSKNVGQSIVSIQSLVSGTNFKTLSDEFNRSFYMIRLAHENRSEHMRWYNQIVNMARQNNL